MKKEKGVKYVCPDGHGACLSLPGQKISVNCRTCGTPYIKYKKPVQYLPFWLDIFKRAKTIINSHDKHGVEWDIPIGIVAGQAIEKNEVLLSLELYLNWRLYPRVSLTEYEFMKFKKEPTPKQAAKFVAAFWQSVKERMFTLIRLEDKCSGMIHVKYFYYPLIEIMENEYGFTGLMDEVNLLMKELEFEEAETLWFRTHYTTLKIEDKEEIGRKFAAIKITGGQAITHLATCKQKIEDSVVYANKLMNTKFEVTWPGVGREFQINDKDLAISLKGKVCARFGKYGGDIFTIFEIDGQQYSLPIPALLKYFVKFKGSPYYFGYIVNRFDIERGKKIWNFKQAIENLSFYNFRDNRQFSGLGYRTGTRRGQV